jgi:hypothetical protein
MWTKMVTTKRGATSIRKEAVTAWKKCWKDMTQERIQKWISCIIRHIQMVILLEGDNKYIEGPFQKEKCLERPRMGGSRCI